MDVNGLELRDLNVFYVFLEVHHAGGDDAFLAVDNLPHFCGVVGVHYMHSHVALFFFLIGNRGVNEVVKKLIFRLRVLIFEGSHYLLFLGGGFLLGFHSLR